MWVGVAARRSTFDEDGDDLFLSLTLSGRVLKWLELQFLEPLYSSVNTSPVGGICDESAATLLGIHMACCWSSSSFWSFPSKLIIVSLPKEKMGLVSRAMFWWQIDKLGSFSAGFVLTLRSSYSRHIFWVWGFDEVDCYLCSYGNIYALHVETTYWGSAWATPPVLNMWPWKLKLDEEKSNHAGLAQQIGFGPAFFAWFAESGKRHSKT